MTADPKLALPFFLALTTSGAAFAQLEKPLAVAPACIRPAEFRVPRTFRLLLDALPSRAVLWPFCKFFQLCQPRCEKEPRFLVDAASPGAVQASQRPLHPTTL